MTTRARDERRDLPDDIKPVVAERALRSPAPPQPPVRARCSTTRASASRRRPASSRTRRSATTSRTRSSSRATSPCATPVQLASERYQRNLDELNEHLRDSREDPHRHHRRAAQPARRGNRRRAGHRRRVEGEHRQARRRARHLAVQRRVLARRARVLPSDDHLEVREVIDESVRIVLAVVLALRRRRCSPRRPVAARAMASCIERQGEARFNACANNGPDGSSTSRKHGKAPTGELPLGAASGRFEEARSAEEAEQSDRRRTPRDERKSRLKSRAARAARHRDSGPREPVRDDAEERARPRRSSRGASRKTTSSSRAPRSARRRRRRSSATT